MNTIKKLFFSTFFAVFFVFGFFTLLQGSGQIENACAASIGVGQQCPSGITNPYDHDVEAVNVNVKVNVTVGTMQPNSTVHIQAGFKDARTSECYVNCLLREESTDISWSGSIDHNFDNLGCSSGACDDTLTVNVNTSDSNCHVDNNSQSQQANANGASVSYNFNITCEAPLPTLPAEVCNCQYEKDCVVNGQPGKQQCGGSNSGGGACRPSNACPTNDANNCTACLPTLSSPTPLPTLTPLPTITTGPGTPTPTPIPTVPTSTPTPIGPTPTGPRPSVTLTPTPTRPVNTPTPTPLPFDKNACACDGLDTPGVFIGTPTTFTAYSKLVGTSANIGMQKFITFYMYKQDPAKPNETGQPIGGPADVNSVLVSNTSSPTRYRSQWLFTDTSKLEKGVTYMVYADTKKGCVQKQTAINFEAPTQVVLAAETQEISFFDKIQGFITRLLSGFSSNNQSGQPTPTPTRVANTPTPTPNKSGNIQLIPFYPANILQKSCQVLRFQLPS